MSEKPISVAFLDVDGVLVSFTQAALAVHHSDLTEEDITSYDMAGIMGIREVDFWKKIDAAGAAFWRDIPVYPWLNRLVVGLRGVADKVVLTTTPGFDESGCLGKKQWINNHFGRGFRDYIFTPRKHYLARTPKSVLIDDSPANVATFREAGGAAVLFPRPWNGGVVPDGKNIWDYVIEQAVEAVQPKSESVPYVSHICNGCNCTVRLPEHMDGLCLMCPACGLMQIMKECHE